VASPEPAVGVFTPAGTCPGRLRRHHVISVIRLHRFQGDHPDVQFTSPVMGRYGQYTALIPPETIPGESREITVKSPDLCGLMDQRTRAHIFATKAA
jgi:hypothetical protein